jgi:outer membrane protein OmpA-like peptidoglycan-associated protein/Mg-chelatase subunit ChlD
MIPTARYVFFLGIFSLSLALCGCPQQVVEMTREIVPPRDYKPIYMTSTIPLDKALEEFRDAARPGVKWSGYSSGASDSTGGMKSARSGPLAMDIRSVDDSRYPDEVELRAFIYDTAGRFVMGLAPPYYKESANWRARWPRLVDSCGGQATIIDSFTVTEVRQDRREPYALAFVLDQSGSMGDDKVRRLRTAVSRTLRIIKAGDRVAAVKFGTRTEVDVPLTDDTARYRREFTVENLLPPGGGGTALYDAAIVGIDEVATAPTGYKRAVILFTDGMDGNSHQRIEDVQRHAREKRVTLYTVAYGAADENVMRTMAAYTGGRMYRIYSNKEFPYVFADIYRGLNNYYRITYRPPACQGIHTATASVSLPELGYDPLMADGRYDRSLFTQYDPVGSVALVNVEFDYDRATIRPESIPSIREVADVLNANPKMTMEVRGHTDDKGGDEYNMKLSQDRAQAVADALAGMGIDRKRLTVKGFGKTMPLVPNDSDENRRKNRRTEFVITGR